MSRVLFRYVVYGIGTALLLDTAWMLVEGKIFPGSILLNKIINALFLGLGVTLGCLWYLYVLDVLNIKLSHNRSRLIMIPGTVFAILNIISIWTGWIFTVNDQNVYERGPLFPLQTVAALFMLFISLIHLIIRRIRSQDAGEKHLLNKLLSFYIIPVIGTLVSMPFTGMPGTWTCASVSVILIYMNDQDDAIVRDSLTGLNNRKNLFNSFSSYTRQITEIKHLYLFLFDLDHFKEINDTLGHPAGDKALVEASQLILHSLNGQQGFVARYGGDEFIVLCFFYGDPNAIEYKHRVKDEFERWNKDHQNPYTLSTSIGFSRYQKGQKLEDMINSADNNLYEEKKSRGKSQK